MPGGRQKGLRGHSFYAHTCMRHAGVYSDMRVARMSREERTFPARLRIPVNMQEYIRASVLQGRRDGGGGNRAGEQKLAPAGHEERWAQKRRGAGAGEQAVTAVQITGTMRNMNIMYVRSILMRTK